MKKNLCIIMTLITLSSVTAFSSNRTANDEIFNEPKKAGWTQIFLGFVELIAAQYAYPGLSNEAKAVKAAELDLEVAKATPTSEADRSRTIKAILNNPNNFDFENEIGDETELKSNAAQKLERIRSTNVVSSAEKEQLIKSASSNVTNARQAALKAAQNLGIVDKSVKVVRVGASLLLVGDVVARIYVWNAMDANPTLSPAAVYLYNQVAE